MKIQLPDVFHCQKCGKLVRQPHGRPIPSCCGELMTCAVSDGVHELPRFNPPQFAARESVNAVPSALSEQFAELSTWCRSRPRTDRPDAVDAACYTELAWQLQPLRGVVLDRFGVTDRDRTDIQQLVQESRFRNQVEHLNRQRQQIVDSLDHMLNDLQRRTSDVHDWSTVCERIDSIVAEVRRQEEAATDLIQESLEQDLGTVD